MFMIFVDNDQVTKIFNSEISTIPTDTETGKWESRHDWKSFERVEQVANEVSNLTGERWLPIDRGENTWPRYDVIIAPKVGDKVSYGFNGDSYPDGEIVAVTKTFRVTTSGGHKYNRVKNSGSWRMTGGTWWMIPGHRSKYNPHF